MAEKKKLTFEIKSPVIEKKKIDTSIQYNFRHREKNLIDDLLDDTLYKNYRDDDILRSDNPTQALNDYKQIESKVKNEDPKIANAIKKQFIQEKENQYAMVSGEPEVETERVFAGPSVGYIEKQVEKPKIQGLTNEEVNVLVELERLRPQFAKIYEEKLKTAQPEIPELFSAREGYGVPQREESAEDVAYQQTIDQMVSEGKMGNKASNLMAEFFNSAIPIGKLTPKEQAELMIQATPGERFIAGGSGMLAGYGMVGKIGRSADTYRKVTRGLDRYLSGVSYGKDSFKVASKLDPVKGRAIAETLGRASSSAQTFGTYTLADMLDENIPTSEKAYQVLNSVMLGTGLGATGTIASPFKRIPAEGLVGFTSGLLESGDPKEATLNALIFMGFGLLNRQNLKQDERTVLWERLGDDFITYFRQSLRNPNLTKEQRVEAKKIILKELRKIKANATPDELRNEIESVKKQILYGVQKMTATRQTEKAIKKQIAGETTRASQELAKKIKKSSGKVPETGTREVLNKDNVLKMSIDQQVKELKGLGFTEDQLVRIGGEDRANIIANAIKPVNYYGKEQSKPKIEIEQPKEPVKVEDKPEPLEVEPEPVEVEPEPVIELPKKIEKSVKPEEKPVQVSEEVVKKKEKQLSERKAPKKVGLYIKDILKSKDVLSSDWEKNNKLFKKKYPKLNPDMSMTMQMYSDDIKKATKNLEEGKDYPRYLEHQDVSYGIYYNNLKTGYNPNGKKITKKDIEDLKERMKALEYWLDKIGLKDWTKIWKAEVDNAPKISLEEANEFTHGYLLNHYSKIKNSPLTKSYLEEIGSKDLLSLKDAQIKEIVGDAIGTGLTGDIESKGGKNPVIKFQITNNPPFELKGKELVKVIRDRALKDKTPSTPQTPKTKKPVESNLVELDPKQVKVDETKFQPREEYNQSVIDDIANNFNASKWDPPVLWQDPKSKDYFVVSGHHRQQGVVKGGIEDAMYKVLPEGTTLAQAKNFAGASNLQATGQSEFETAAEIRRRVEEGDSYDDIASDMPGLFKNVKNKTNKLKNIQKLAYLDPKGKFKEHFDNTEFPKIVNRARQIAQLRKSYDWLTDKHEDDVFTYLYKEGGISKDQDLFDLGLIKSLEKLDNQKDKPESIIKLLRKEPVKPAENTHTEVLKVVDDLKAQVKTIEAKLNSKIEIDKLIDARLNGSGTITENYDGDDDYDPGEEITFKEEYDRRLKMLKDDKDEQYGPYPDEFNDLSSNRIEWYKITRDAWEPETAQYKYYDRIYKHWKSSPEIEKKIKNDLKKELRQVKKELMDLIDKTNAPDPKQSGLFQDVKPFNAKSTAFKKWFGDSKVVDENGKPLVVYHGTVGDFDSFNTPSYFSDAKMVSQFVMEGIDFFGEQPIGENIKPVYLSIQNPKIYTTEQEYDDYVMSPSPTFDSNLETLKNQGFDGILYKPEDIGSSTYYVAFKPTQIKSIFNKGTFDPKDPSILMQSLDQYNMFGGMDKIKPVNATKRAELDVILDELHRIKLERDFLEKQKADKKINAIKYKQQISKLRKEQSELEIQRMKVYGESPQTGLFQSVSAYHGSPHTFKKFKMSAMGTGEGGQAYGYGLYFTDNLGIANYYAKNLSGSPTNNYTIGGLDLAKNEEYIDYSPHVLERQWWKYKPYIRPSKRQPNYPILNDVNDLSVIIEDLLIDENKVMNIKNSDRGAYLENYFNDQINSTKEDMNQEWNKEYKDEFVGKIRILELLQESVKKDNFIFEPVKNKNLYKVKLKSKDPKKMKWLEWDKEYVNWGKNKEKGSLSGSFKKEWIELKESLYKVDPKLPSFIQNPVISKTEIVTRFNKPPTKKIVRRPHPQSSAPLTGKRIYQLMQDFIGRNRSKLARKYGDYVLGARTDQVASDILSKLGYDGNKYLSIGGTGGKEGKEYNYVVFDEEAIEIETHNLYQSMKDWDKLKNPYRPNTNETQKETAKILRKELQANLPGENSLPPRRRRYTIQGNGITEPLARKGFVSLVGTRVSNTKELASASQILRDPRYETARLFFVKNNKIVHQSAVTSRLPGAVANLFPGDVFPMINQNIKNFEADSFYLLHNHPGGDSKPSGGDLGFTEIVANNYPKSFKGHVVINSNNYSVINKNIKVERHEVDFGKDKLLQPSKPHPWLGTKLSSPKDLEKLGRKIQNRGFITLLNISSNSDIRGVIDVPVTTFDLSTKKVMATLRDIARKTGSVQSVAVVGGYESGITAKQMERLMEMTDRQAITSVVMNNNGNIHSVIDSNSDMISFETFKKGTPPKVVMQQPVKKFKSNRQKALARAHILEAEIGLAEKEKKILKKSITGFESLGQASDSQISAYVDYLLEQKYGNKPISKPTIKKKTLKDIREEKLLQGDRLEKSVLERASIFLDKPKDFLGTYWVNSRQSMERTLEKMGKGGQKLARMYREAEYYHSEKVKPLEAEMERLWKKVPTEEKELMRNIIESDGASDLSKNGQAFVDFWGRLTDDIYNEGKKYMNPDLNYIQNYFPLQLKMDFYKEVNPQHKLWDEVVDHVQQILKDRISQADIFTGLNVSREEAEQYTLDFLNYYKTRGLREHFIQQVFKPSGKFKHSYPLEMHRDRIFPEWAYEQDIMNVAHGYIDKSFEAISFAKEFGKIDEDYKYENIDTQLDLIERDGFSRNDAQNIMSWAMGLKNFDEYDRKMNRFAKNTTSFLLSFTTTLKNLTDLGKAFSQSGTVPTLKSAFKLMFNKKERELSKDLIGSQDVFRQSLEKTGVGSGVASFYTKNIIQFTRSEQGVRQIIGHSRILQAEHLLRNYDPGKKGIMQNHIKRMFELVTDGLNIDKIKKRGNLNRSEILRIGNYAIGQTQPASNLDRPINWISKGFWLRKSIFQSFSHKSIRWLKNFVLKEARHGNMMPLVNLMVWRMTLGYGYQELIRWVFNTKPEEEETHFDKAWQSFTETGEIGIISDLLFLVQHNGWASPFVSAMFGPKYGVMFELLWNVFKTAGRFKEGKEEPFKPLKRQIAKKTIKRVPFVGKEMYEEQFPKKITKPKKKKVIRRKQQSN